MPKRLPLHIFLLIALEEKGSSNSGLTVILTLQAWGGFEGARVESGSQWVFVERGANYEIYRNSTLHRWVSAAKWVYNGTAWVPYIFTNFYASEGYVTVQAGLIGAEFHKGKVVYYDPTLADLAVGRENFLVFR